MVQPYIDGKLSDTETESFISHIKKCPSCYDELETYFTIHYALKYLDEDSNRSYNIKKILSDDIKRKENQIHRRRNERIGLNAIIAFAEGILAFCIVLSFLPDSNATILQQIADFFALFFKGGI